MTPQQKIKQKILSLIVDDHYSWKNVRNLTGEEVDEWYEYLDGRDFKGEVREGEVETDIAPGTWSRHYECKSVASQMLDGSWVGWTYWYGGGKHGDPESIDWMSDAYDLEVTEEQKLVTVRTFKLKEQPNETDNGETQPG